MRSYRSRRTEVDASSSHLPTSLGKNHKRFVRVRTIDSCAQTAGAIDHLCSTKASCSASAVTLTAISPRSFSLSSLSRCSCFASASLIRRCSLRHLRARARAFLCLERQGGIGRKDGRMTELMHCFKEGEGLRGLQASVTADVLGPPSLVSRSKAVVSNRQRSEQGAVFGITQP